MPRMVEILSFIFESHGFIVLSVVIAVTMELYLINLWMVEKPSICLAYLTCIFIIMIQLACIFCPNPQMMKFSNRIIAA